jgi:hypothetical protein
LFYLDLARLSVDIDQNYIGHVGLEEMLSERPDQHLGAIVRALSLARNGLISSTARADGGEQEFLPAEWRGLGNNLAERK